MEFVMHKKFNISQWDVIINYYVKYMFWENYNTIHFDFPFIPEEKKRS